ncbi:MAG: hypothetical protein ACRBFS_25935 [Aureispira sp.]
MEQLLAVFETWEADKMRTILSALNTEQETALLERYEGIMKFAKIKRLQDMITIVDRITEKTVAKKTRWKPNEVDQKIIASLPIKKIDLSYVELKKGLPKWMESINPEHLEEIDLSGNDRLTELPDWVASCTQLTILHAYSVGLKSLPNTFENLCKLSINAETLVGSTIDWSKMTALERLMIAAEELKEEDKAAFYTLISQFGELPNLKDLSINDYPYDTVPSTWTRLKNLTTLELGHFKDGQETGVSSRFFSINCTGYYKGRPSMPGQYKSKEALQYFIRAASSFEGQNEKDLLYQYLESDQVEWIKKGLAMANQDALLKQQAEKRYLNILKALLNKPNATLEDLLSLKDIHQKAEEARMLLMGNVLDFSYKEKPISRMLVDILGGLTKNFVDVDELLKEVATMEEELTVQRHFSALCAAFRAYLELEMCQGLLATNGWLQRLLQTIKNSRIFSIEEIRFNHTDFDLANKSTVLQAFFVFVGAHASSRIVIDVAQSTVPNLTPIYWLYWEVPPTTWLDVSPTFPASPLSFERSTTYRVGDSGSWKKKKA